MELSIQQQIFEQFNKANKVLIALPKTLDADNVGSALALKQFLTKIGKEADVASAGSVPENVLFLPEASEIRKTLSGGKSFVISIDTRQKELDEISYETAAGKVEIFVKSKNEQFAPEDVSFVQDKFPYDLVVILDSRSLEDLGELFEGFTETFFGAPKINIDNHPGNEFFAAINLVDINATSVAETLAQLLSGFETPLIDEDIATSLLAGIITKTNSFQHSKTTPAAFMRASELVTLGGRQQEVVKFLYKTKSLPLLRLWGRALARLKIQDPLSTVYSLLNATDFQKAESSEEDLMLVLKELVDNISGYKIVGLLSESDKSTRLLLALHPTVAWEELLKVLGVQSEPTQPLPLPLNVLNLTLDVPFAEAENKFLQAVRVLPTSPQV